MGAAPESVGPLVLPPLPSDSARRNRGRLLAARPHAITPISPTLFLVRSPSTHRAHRVRCFADRWTCTCPDFLARGLPCKHAFAVDARVRGLPLSTEPPPAARPTYAQNWPAYTQGQLSEFRLVHALLADLVTDVADPRPPTGFGRPRLRFSDLLFCSVQKVYTQLSLRRAYGHFEMAADLHQIRQAPSFVQPSLLFRREDVTPLLLALILRSALPLADLESTFAVDASGYRTTSFGAYCQETHGPSRANTWRKAHLVVGTATHVVPAVIVTEGTGADVVQFAPLLRSVTEAGFTVREVCADKAYLSRSNLDAARSVGVQPYIPFKSNSSGRAEGSSAWRELYRLFHEQRAEFDHHFHRRSNVESVFGAMKKKLGETLKSRAPIAQINELLAKVLAYNLTVLVHEMFEHRRVPDFLRRVAIPRELATR